MVRPVGHPLRRRAVSIHDLREEFLARCQARNLSDRTIQWYEERSRQFAEWCTAPEIVLAGDLVVVTMSLGLGDGHHAPAVTAGTVHRRWPAYGAS